MFDALQHGNPVPDDVFGGRFFLEFGDRRDWNMKGVFYLVTIAFDCQDNVSGTT